MEPDKDSAVDKAKRRAGRENQKRKSQEALRLLRLIGRRERRG